MNTFLSARDKFIPEMHLKQPRFTHSPCGPFTKNEDKKFKETEDSKHIYENDLHKACFQHMAYGDFKDFPRRTTADYYVIKHLVLLKIQNMMDIKAV